MQLLLGYDDDSGSFTLEPSNVKAVFGEKILSEMGPKNNLRFCFRDPQKALPCAEPRRQPSHFLPRGAKSRMRRTETPKPIWIKFCMVVGIPDVVNYTNFGDHRLRGFWVAGGQISPSPIDFHRRPYNTLARASV